MLNSLLQNFEYMVKREMLDIILKDIKELELLVKGMTAMETVPATVQELAKVKTRNVFDGLCEINSEEQRAVLKEQLAKVEALADAGVAAPRIEDGSPATSPQSAVEPPQAVVVETPVIPQVETKKQEPIVVEEKKNEASLNIEVSLQEVDNEEVNKKAEKEDEKNIEPTPEIGTVIADETNKELQERYITNERFRARPRSLNETIQVRKPETRFVVSLKKAINLNDRFRYQRELFSNDSSAMNAAIEALDAMSTLAEAKQYVSNFGWDEKSEVVADFMQLLEARFSHIN